MTEPHTPQTAPATQQSEPSPEASTQPGTQTSTQQQESFYDQVGGAETFEHLVTAFYRGVAEDEPLRALYPEEDLGPAERRLRMFLEQYFGGPKTYSEERGHPRLRMRHHPFPVTLDMRDRWLRHMINAMDEVDIPEAHAEQMRDYFFRAAHMLVNTPD